MILPLLASAVVAASSTTSEDVIELYPEPAPEVEETEILIPDPDEGEPVEALEDARPPFARSSIKLETRVGADTSHDLRGEHIFELGLGGRLEIDVDLGERLSAYAAPSFYYVAALGREGEDRHEVFLTTPEARVTWAVGPFDLRAGALVFNWGASDLIGPSDVLNPLDYRRNFVAAIDDLKIPVIAAELITGFGPLTVRAVVEPFFTPSRYFVSTWDTALIQPTLMSGFDVRSLEALLGKETVDAVGDQILLPSRPSVRPDDATLALRATVRLGDLDLSATAVHGWEPLPQISVHPDLIVLTSQLAEGVAGRRLILPDIETIQRLQAAIESGEGVFTGTYHRRDMIGFDAVYAVDPFVFKLDNAYSFARTAYTQDYRPVTNPWLNSVVGFEYVSGDALTVIVEAFNITIFDVPSDLRLQFFEPHAPPPSVSAAGRRTLAIPGVAGAVLYSAFDGDLGVELAGVATLTRGDVLFMPAVHYRMSDALDVTVGATVVEGKEDGYGGAFSHNDEVFVRLQWTH